jgi:hypothetical protein
MLHRRLMKLPETQQPAVHNPIVKQLDFPDYMVSMQPLRLQTQDDRAAGGDRRHAPPGFVLAEQRSPVTLKAMIYRM